MNFGFLLGLCLFNFINAKYLLVNVDEEQQVRGPKPPAPVLVTKPPVAPKRPLPTCIQPGGKCLGNTKLSINIEFSARSVKGPAECCQGYTCVSGMCLKPRISLDGLGKKVDIDGRARALAPKFYHIEGWKDCTGSKDMGSFTIHCLPSHRPEKCKYDAWIELNDLAKKEPSEAPGPCEEKSSGVLPVILCRKHQETCGLLFGGPGKCCDGLKCERNFKFGLPGTCVKAQIEDQCYFQYGFGSRMVPCCFNIISREEYDRLVEEHAKNPIVGGAIGKHHSCPKNAEEAHQIVSGKCKNHGEKCGRQGSKDYGKCCEEGMCAGPAGGVTHCVEASELELPSLCRAHFDTCGYEATNPQKQHGDCCVGMKCERAWLEEVGKCVIEKCKNHGEKCGRQAILNAKDYGKCCEGSICQAEKPGAIMKCVKESQKQSRGQCVPPCSDGDICCTDTHTCASSCS